jgi:tetratricopeptide (TPR) repeat protein
MQMPAKTDTKIKKKTALLSFALVVLTLTYLPGSSGQVPGSGPVGSAPGQARPRTSAAIVQIKENGKREILQHDTSHALIDLQKYCQTDWTDPEGHFWLAYALAETGQKDAAILEYKQAEEKEVVFGLDCAELRLNRGNLLAQSGKMVEAESEFRRAIEIEPIVLDARLSLAQLLLAQDRVTEAFNELGQCSAARKDDPRFCYLEAIANLKRGQLDAPIEWLRKCQVTSNQSLSTSRSDAMLLAEAQKLLQFLRAPH